MKFNSLHNDGKFFSELNAIAKNLQMTGIDLSHEMVSQAVRNNAGLFKSGSMKVKMGSSDNLPFDDNSFDKVFCINVIYLWEAPQVHLKEIYRVLKWGGKLYTAFRPAGPCYNCLSQNMGSSYMQKKIGLKYF